MSVRACLQCLLLGVVAKAWYQPFSSKVNWYLAQHDCQQRGGTLASPRDDTTEADMAGAVTDNSQDYWIGASQAQDGLSWVLDDGSALDNSWIPWDTTSSEPNDICTDHCVRIVFRSGQPKWRTMHCSKTYYYICHFDADTTTPATITTTLVSTSGTSAAMSSTSTTQTQGSTTQTQSTSGLDSTSGAQDFTTPHAPDSTPPSSSRPDCPVLATTEPPPRVSLPDRILDLIRGVEVGRVRPTPEFDGFTSSDHRGSAIGLGTLGIATVVFLMALIVLMDATLLLSQCKRMKNHIVQKSRLIRRKYRFK